MLPEAGAGSANTDNTDYCFPTTPRLQIRVAHQVAQILRGNGKADPRWLAQRRLALLDDYDKIKDMKQAKISEKRAIESDYAIQQDLFTKEIIKKPLEVLRMELRIGNRTKLKSLMKELGIVCPTNFESLFNQNISQRMLLHFWRAISLDMPTLALSNFRPGKRSSCNEN